MANAADHRRLAVRLRHDFAHGRMAPAGREIPLGIRKPRRENPLRFDGDRHRIVPGALPPRAVCHGGACRHRLVSDFSVSLVASAPVHPVVGGGVRATRAVLAGEPCRGQYPRLRKAPVFPGAAGKKILEKFNANNGVT